MSGSTQCACAVVSHWIAIALWPGLVACDGGAADRTPPKIVDILGPTRVSLNDTVAFAGQLDQASGPGIEVVWRLSGPGRLEAERLVTAPFLKAVTEYVAPKHAGVATLQLIVSSAFGLDHAEKTITIGNEAPYLHKLELLRESGETQAIEVPEVGSAIAVHPGERLSLVAEAVDYDNDPLTYKWLLKAANAAQACSLSAGLFQLESTATTDRVVVVAPKALCSAALELNVTDGSATWVHEVVTLHASSAPPVIESIRLPEQPAPGQTVEASAVVAVDSATPVSYEWSVDARYAEMDLSSQQPTISFALLDAAAQYSVCLAVEDPYGQRASKCSTLTVASDWHWEGELAGAPTLGIVPPDEIYGLSYLRKLQVSGDSGSTYGDVDWAIIQHINRQTKQVKVLAALPEMALGASAQLPCTRTHAVGNQFYCSSANDTIVRMDGSSATAIESSSKGRYFVTAGKLWELTASRNDASLSWRSLQADTWAPSGHTVIVTESSQLDLADALAGEDGNFLVSFHPSDGATGMLECHVDRGCGSVMPMQGYDYVQYYGRAADGSGLALGTGTAYRSDADGWYRLPPLPSTMTYRSGAIGSGQVCAVVTPAQSSNVRSVWCVTDAGWASLGMENVDWSCFSTALTLIAGTAYFSCDGRLYSHTLGRP